MSPKMDERLEGKHQKAINLTSFRTFYSVSEAKKNNNINGKRRLGPGSVRGKEDQRRMHKNVMFNIIYFFCSFVSFGLVRFHRDTEHHHKDHSTKKVLPDAFWVLLFLFLFGLLVCFTFFFSSVPKHIFLFQRFTFLCLLY